MFNHKNLPPGSVKVTVNVASQLRIFIGLDVLKELGFRLHGKAEFTIITREGKRIGVLEALDNDDSRNGAKRVRGCYRIQHENGWTECTIIVGKYAKENLVKMSKGEVESWSPKRQCLEFMLPHRFRKENGVLAEEKQTMAVKTTANKKKSKEETPTSFDLDSVNAYIRDFKQYNSLEQTAIWDHFNKIDRPT